MKPKTFDTVMAEWVGAASLDQIIRHSHRRGPTPVLNVGKKLYRAQPGQVQTMTVYGRTVSQRGMPFLPFEEPAAALSVEEAFRAKIAARGPGPSNPAARLALGYPVDMRHQPNERTGRPDGTRP